jgi:hypothetical protein
MSTCLVICAEIFNIPLSTDIVMYAVCSEVLMSTNSVIKMYLVLYLCLHLVSYMLYLVMYLCLYTLFKEICRKVIRG